MERHEKFNERVKQGNVDLIFIGDSITAGYRSSKEALTAYGWVTAEKLGAAHTQIARPSVCLYPTTDGCVGMRDRWLKTGLDTSTPDWDFSRYRASAVVINLGTNDISNGKGDPGTAFRDTYRGLLETIRAEYPHTYIVCIIAPLLNGGDLSTITGHIKAAVDARVAAGDSKVELFSAIPPQTSDKYACQYHPNVAENQLMADLLVTELKAKLGW